VDERRPQTGDQNLLRRLRSHHRRACVLLLGQKITEKNVLQQKKEAAQKRT
jgi:hypothetical protein